MNVTPEILAMAKALANQNYETWGQYVVECYTDDELIADLQDFQDLAEWIDVRVRVGEVYAELDAAI
jgi:hypothetical protein